MADIVAAELERRGMSKQEFADRVGLHRVQLSLWLNGQRPLRVDYLLPMLDELGLIVVDRDTKRPPPPHRNRTKRRGPGPGRG